MTEQLDTTADVLQEGPELLRTKAEEGYPIEAWMDENNRGELTGYNPHNGNKMVYSEGDEEQPGYMRETPENALFRSGDNWDVLYTSEDPEETALFYNAMENEIDNRDATRAVDWNQPVTEDQGGIRGLLGGEKDVHWVHFTGAESIGDAARRVMGQYQVPETGEIPDELEAQVKGADLELQDEGYWQSNPRGL